MLTNRLFCIRHFFSDKKQPGRNNSSDILFGQGGFVISKISDLFFTASEQLILNRFSTFKVSYQKSINSREYLSFLFLIVWYYNTVEKPQVFSAFSTYFAYIFYLNEPCTTFSMIQWVLNDICKVYSQPAIIFTFLRKKIFVNASCCSTFRVEKRVELYLFYQKELLAIRLILIRL